MVFFRAVRVTLLGLGREGVQLVFVLEVDVEDEVLDTASSSGLLVKAVLVQSHDLTNTIHKLLFLVQIERLEDQA